MDITIGCDPEIFVISKDKSVPLSMHDKVPGTKKEPHKLDHGAVQADGTAMEFNIDPCSTPEEFVSSIKSVLGQLEQFVPKDFKMSFTPVVHYPKEYFNSLPKEAKELGCDPDFNAFNDGKPNPRPDNRTTMRTASGHIHIGWGKNLDIQSKSHLWDCMEVVRTVESAILPFKSVWDTDTKRQKMYGKPGCFRPKSYGVEWRTLSNAWLNHPILWPWLFRTIAFSISMLEKGFSHNPVYAYEYEHILLDQEEMYRKSFRIKIVKDKIMSRFPKDFPEFPIEEIANNTEW